MLKKLLLASALALGLATTQANAAEFTLSQAFGTGNFGTMTGVFLANGTTAEITIDMSPNAILDTGNGHIALGISLAGGTIDASTLDALNPGLPAGTYSVLPHVSPASYNNSPFGLWTDGIAGACGSGSSSGGCGSTLVFDILNFQGFLPATNTFGSPPVNVFASVDIYLSPEGPTGAVGLGAAPTITTHSVPGPIAGAGLPGLIVACSGLLALARRRRRQPV